MITIIEFLHRFSVFLLILGRLQLVSITPNHEDKLNSSTTLDYERGMYAVQQTERYRNTIKTPIQLHWAAANGGVTNGGLRGVLIPLKSAFSGAFGPLLPVKLI